MYTSLSLLTNVCNSLYNKWYPQFGAAGRRLNFWLNYDLYNSDDTGYIIYNIKLICLLYAGIDIQNNMLSNTEQHDLNIFLLSHLNSNGLFVLLYRGNEKIFDCDIFRKICRNCPNILIIMRNKYDDVLFGGYTCVGIKGIGEYVSYTKWFTDDKYKVFDDNAFLYRFVRQTNENKKNKKFAEIFKVKKKKENYAINKFMNNTKETCDICHFGLNDLFLTRYKQTNILRAISIPKVYALSSGEQLCGQSTLKFVKEHKNKFWFDIDMIEIYQLKSPMSVNEL